MPDFDDIFQNQAPKYEHLVSKEDHQGNLVRSISAAVGLSATLDVADLGSGTGRMTFLLAPRVRTVIGIEPVDGMRAEAERKKARLGVKNVEFRKGEHTCLPLQDRSVDLVVEGWAFLVLFGRSFPNWQTPMDRAFAELQRVLRPGGCAVFVETFGTLDMWESPPERVAVLYDYFQHIGYNRTLIRTDYKFSDVEEAIDLTAFFFGDKAGQTVRERGWLILPELTAVWTRKY